MGVVDWKCTTTGNSSLHHMGLSSNLTSKANTQPWNHLGFLQNLNMRTRTESDHWDSDKSWPLTLLPIVKENTSLFRVLPDCDFPLITPSFYIIHRLFCIVCPCCHFRLSMSQRQEKQGDKCSKWQTVSFKIGIILFLQHNLIQTLSARDLVTAYQTYCLKRTRMPFCCNETNNPTHLMSHSVQLTTA